MTYSKAYRTRLANTTARIRIIADLSSGDYVSANKFGELETGANGYKTQLETLNAEIGKLKKESGSTNDEISRRLGELQTKYDTDTEALKKTIGDLKFNGALDAAIAAAGAKSAKALKGVIDMDKIKFDDGKLIGFNEQLDGLKKDYPAVPAAIKDNTAVTITAGHTANLVFNPNAFAFVIISFIMSHNLVLFLQNVSFKLHLWL